MVDASPPLSRMRAVAIGVLAAAGLGAYVLTSGNPRTQALVSEAVVVVAALGAAFMILDWAGGWPGARPMSVLLGLLGLGNLMFFVLDLVDPGTYMPKLPDLAFLLFLVPLGFFVYAEFQAHFEPHDQREIGVDAALVVVSLATLFYLLLLPVGATPVVSMSAAVFAIVSAALLTAFALLALWVPTTPHLLLFVATAPAAIGTLQFGSEWAGGMFDGTSPVVDLGWMLTPLAVAATMALNRHDGGIASTSTRLARPALTSVAVMTACSALALVAILDDERGIAGGESTAIILLLGAGVAVRILANQVASAQAHDRVHEAMQRQESALSDTDSALARLRAANETLRRSEEHLRLVFEVAVDGFVELDEQGRIVRANEAFADMVNLDRRVIEGQPWTAMAASVEGAEPSLLTLPETGHAEIHRTEGQVLHVESRLSEVPTDPPRRLLLVRDVTAAKVSDRTIRSLFQFLQDRDEDRTRLLRRTNAAIEQERNRIARDLHDGPVQGVSAASLSLEASLLMIRGGDVERGLELLARIRRELAEEADALRRMMAGLRPPVLEERGLLPALRETLTRFEGDYDVMTEFSGQLVRSLPEDLETLAFRVVQEAMTNVGRHAGATMVSVRVATDLSQLRIEVEDDGQGFDTSQTRDFLRVGRVGLATMRERVELASGTFAIRSSPGRGTAVLATIPLDAALAIVGR